MTLTLTTAGESHGPALVAIVGGLPAGLVLDRDAINDDLRRRQQGYGRSPRQRIETDEVEVLAGLRHGRTLGTPLALVVRNRDHANWEWGMAPWPPDGEPFGKGTRAVTVPRPGHADLAGTLKYGLSDARDALERASARSTAAAVAAGAVAKGLLRRVGVDVAGEVVEAGGESWRRPRGRRLERRADRRAGRDEAAADADEATADGRPRNGRAGGGARRAKRRRGGRGVRRRRRGRRRLGARARRPREIRRRLRGRLRRRTPRVRRAHRLGAPLDKHLALVGFMGAGKSSLGREAAARLGRPFVDLDREIEARAGLGIPEIFRERGEAGFRDLEEAVWHDVVSDARPTVFALGGGAVTSAAVR